MDEGLTLYGPWSQPQVEASIVYDIGMLNCLHTATRAVASLALSIKKWQSHREKVLIHFWARCGSSCVEEYCDENINHNISEFVMQMQRFSVQKRLTQELALITFWNNNFTVQIIGIKVYNLFIITFLPMKALLQIENLDQPLPCIHFSDVSVLSD